MHRSRFVLKNTRGWPPKQNNHPKGTRLPSGQRAHEDVEALWSQVLDRYLLDWMRRSSLLHLVLAARSHRELILACVAGRVYEFASSEGVRAVLDTFAAIRAVDLGWTLEVWTTNWITKVTPSMGKLMAGFEDVAEHVLAKSGRVPPVPLPPSRYSHRFFDYTLPWVDFRPFEVGEVDDDEVEVGDPSPPVPPVPPVGAAPSPRGPVPYLTVVPPSARLESAPCTTACTRPWVPRVVR